MLIEPECAGMAAQQASPAQIAAIRDAHEGMSLTDSPGRHDREFHNAIAAACGNAAVAAAVARLWELTQASSVYSRMQDYFVNTKVWAAAHAEHQRILVAIQARDPIRARHAMHAHLLGILARLREDFGDDSTPRNAHSHPYDTAMPQRIPDRASRAPRMSPLWCAALTQTKHCCSGSTRSTPENAGGMRFACWRMAYAARRQTPVTPFSSPEARSEIAKMVLPEARRPWPWRPLPAAGLAQTKGGTLRHDRQPGPPVIVTAINQRGPTQFVAGKIYESLLTYSTELKPQPGLAKSWEASPDGLTYTFHLQENVKWHDGKPFSSEDVVFSLADMLPKTHARARVILNKFVDSVQAPDAKTVVVKLKTPFPAFMLMFEPGFAPIMPKHLYAGTDYMTNPANQKPVGTGPFMFKEWKRGEYIKLTRNPDYWKPGKPYLDELVFNVIPDAASRAVAFERGSVDVLRGDVDNVDIKRLRACPGGIHHRRLGNVLAPGLPDLQHAQAAFDNLKVRQAVMAAINRNMVVNNIFFGLGKVSTSPFVTTEMFYDKNMPALPST